MHSLNLLFRSILLCFVLGSSLTACHNTENSQAQDQNTNSSPNTQNNSNNTNPTNHCSGKIAFTAMTRTQAFQEGIRQAYECH